MLNFLANKNGIGLKTIILGMNDYVLNRLQRSKVILTSSQGLYGEHTDWRVVTEGVIDTISTIEEELDNVSKGVCTSTFNYFALHLTSQNLVCSCISRKKIELFSPMTFFPEHSNRWKRHFRATDHINEVISLGTR